MLSDNDKKVSPGSNVDVGDVKFTENQNGDAKLDIGKFVWIYFEFSGISSLFGWKWYQILPFCYVILKLMVYHLCIFYLRY